MIFSNTATTVEKAAKVRKRKKSAPQSLPPLIFAKIFGRVMKISPGPASGLTPKAKQAGIMIKPAIRATKVSNAVTVMASPVRE